MKQSSVSIKKIALLFVLSGVLLILGHSLAKASEQKPNDINTMQNNNAKPSNVRQTQLGFYDLLSEQQEIYDIEVTPTLNNNYIASLTMQADPHFLLKGKIELVKGDDKNYSHLAFTPVHYQNPETNRIIHSLVDYTTYNDILIHDLKVNTNQLIISHLGILILMPDTFSLPK